MQTHEKLNRFVTDAGKHIRHENLRFLGRQLFRTSAYWKNRSSGNIGCSKSSSGALTIEKSERFS